MRELLNTLYVQTAGTVLHLDHDSVLARVDGQLLGRVPLRRLEGIAAIGRVSITPPLIHKCAETGIVVSWFSSSGRYSGTFRGRTTGNVLLRLDQYRCHENVQARLALARIFVAAKLINCARFTRHAAHLATSESKATTLRARAHTLEDARLALAKSPSLDSVRGVEGSASREHFLNVRLALKRETEFTTRTRRPPLSSFNAVLSFVYSLARLRIEHACDGVGLDPQVGYLHHVRPGRPALALDLLEEHRPALDHLCVTLNNRGQLPDRCFEHQDGGAVMLNEAAQGGPYIVDAYLEKEVQHHVLKESIAGGLRISRTGDHSGPPLARRSPSLPSPANEAGLVDFLLAYDVSTVDPKGAARLRRVAKVCEGFGIRVQKSVFELVLNPHEIPLLLRKLEQVIDPSEDSIRLYRIDKEPLAELGLELPLTTSRGPLII